ncbi:DUF1269 domain-containing protein [Hydrogenophaga sp.]|uniref:DUF1269 domain-containing protein n=1 Tax=Hydrogenophaga sp. TaxID=1904254 RepID=UPI0025C32D88|nr:DUF1269 domain-containing protein [Hydrogenophaga sp.]
MRRIYFLLPTVTSARSIVEELLLNHVDEHHIHVVARDNTPLGDLPQAGVAQRTDIIPAMERGIAAGGLVGLLAGLIGVTFPPAGLVFGGGALLGTIAFGTGFGAWMAGMVGVGMPSSRIEQFQQAIANGELLMMIDVPAARVEEVESLVTRHHAEAELEGVDPNIPLFP